MALAIDYKRYPLTQKLGETECSEIYTYLRSVTPSDIERLSANILGKTPFFGQFWDEFEASRWTIVALAGFFRGVISEDQFATIALLSAAVQQFINNPGGYSCFSYKSREGAVTHDWTFTKIEGAPKEGRKIQVLDTCDPRYEECLGKFFRFLNSEQRGLLKEKMSRSSLLADRCIILVPAPWSPLQYIDPMMFRVALATGTNLCPFTGDDRFFIEGEKHFVLPAFSLLRSAFLLGSVPIHLKPVLGEVKQEDVVADRFAFAHVVGLDIRGARLPNVADGHAAGKIGFSVHDIYHSYTYWKSPSIKSMYVVNRILKVLTREEPRPPLLDKLISFYADSEFVRFSEFHGSLGFALNEGGMLFSEGRIFRQKILEDVARYHPFWKWICPLDDFGLTGEDLAFVREHQSGEWPSYIEMAELVKKQETIFEIVQALQSFSKVYPDHFSLACQSLFIKVFSFPEQMRLDLLAFIVAVGTAKQPLSAELGSKMMLDLFRAIQSDDRRLLEKYAQFSKLKSITLFLTLIFSSISHPIFSRILQCLDQCDFFDPSISRKISVETDSGEIFCYILLNHMEKKQYYITNLEPAQRGDLQERLKDLFDLKEKDQTKFVLDSFNAVRIYTSSK